MPYITYVLTRITALKPALAWRAGLVIFSKKKFLGADVIEYIF